MKLALIGPTFPFRGGISHYTTLLYRALSNRHQVGFFSLYRQYPQWLFPGRTQIDRSDAAFQVANRPSLSPINPLSWLITARRVARFDPELIVLSWWHPFFAPAFGSVARLARWSVRRPSCFLCHNVIPHESTPVDRLLLRYAFGSGAAFITHSREDARQLERLRPGARIYLNPHPTYEVFAAGPRWPNQAAKAALGLGGKRVLLHFGFIRDYKGLDHLLRAMERLEPQAGYHLLLVGEFYVDRAQYQVQLDRLAQRGQLTLVDRYVPNDEVALYFSAADLVTLPYVSATQSGIVQIAYGFEKPVLATAVGGLPEVVIDGETGYLVPPADAAAIAAAVRRHFETGEPERMRRRIVEESRRFSWEAMVRTIERVAQDLRA
ncbi:MAG TPA: glycosyltransferase [Acidobacteriota bacterium]